MEQRYLNIISVIGKNIIKVFLAFFSSLNTTSYTCVVLFSVLVLSLIKSCITKPL